MSSLLFKAATQLQESFTFALKAHLDLLHDLRANDTIAGDNFTRSAAGEA
jgi:hypothetical protein